MEIDTKLFVGTTVYKELNRTIVLFGNLSYLCSSVVAKQA